MARFVTADIWTPRAFHKIGETCRTCPRLPFSHCSWPHSWIRNVRALPPLLVGAGAGLYEDQDHLLAALAEKVIEPAETKAKEQTKTASSIHKLI